MSKVDPILTKMREICLSLPDTKETLTWGQPHFRVGDKIFSGYGEEKGKKVIGFKLEMDHEDAMLDDPRFWRARAGPRPRRQAGECQSIVTQAPHERPQKVR